MKKLLVAFVAVVAVSFASCGGNTEATVNDSDSIDTTTTVVEEPVVEDSAANDSAANDSAVVEASVAE